MKIIYSTLLFVLVGCDVAEPLGSGYEYAATDSYSNGIYKGNRIFVQGYIKKYRVYGNYIVGEKSVSPDFDRSWFFIVNKARSECLDNLSEDRYKELLIKVKSEDLDWEKLKNSGVEVFGVREAEVIFK